MWSAAVVIGALRVNHAMFVGLTVVPNFDYHDTVTIGETSNTVLLLFRVLHDSASQYYHRLRRLQISKVSR